MSAVQVYLDARAAEAVSGQNWTDSKVLRSIADQVRSDLGRMYRLLDRLDAQIAELEPTPEFPKPRYRTSTQEKVARCPRCRGDVAA